MALALSAMFVGALLVEAVSIADLLVNVIEAPLNQHSLPQR